MVVAPEHYVSHQRTVNHEPRHGPGRPGGSRLLQGTENRYSHDADVSNEWMLVTIEHLLTTAYRVFGALF